jgi:hypothetical protein
MPTPNNQTYLHFLQGRTPHSLIRIGQLAENARHVPFPPCWLDNILIYMTRLLSSLGSCCKAAWLSARLRMSPMWH